MPRWLLQDHCEAIAPPDSNSTTHIPQAIAEVSDKPITHMIYSHSHIDHIGGAKALGGRPVIIAQVEIVRTQARQFGFADPQHFARARDA